MEDDIHLRARAVRLAIFDVDGVLTDGRLHYTGSGEEIKVFDVRDGHGLKILQASGVELAIITSRKSAGVARRAADLGIDHVFQGVEEKLSTFGSLVERLALQPAQCAYMGDDWVDLPVLTRCGFAVSVPDAPAAVRQRVHYVTSAEGGRGAVREACELIMHAQGTFETHLARYIA